MKSYFKSSILFVAVVLMVLGLTTQAAAAPVTFDKTLNWTIPDLSQRAPFVMGPWEYCAPTSAGNALWAYYANGDNTLVQAGANNNQKADNTIITLAGAAYMNTNPATGTSTINMVNGLQGYANNFGTTVYTVSLITAFNTGPGGGLGTGQTLWNTIMNELARCEQVMPLISFVGAPNSHNDVEYLQLDYDEDNPNPSGHAVTMTQYNNTVPAVPTISVNNPANNAAHSFVAENATWNLTPLPTSLQINNGPYQGKWIVGAVTMSPVPIPGAVWLLGSALVGLVTIRRRFHN